MAGVSTFYSDLDLQKTLQLLGARLQNLANQTAEDNLAATLGVGNAGLVVYRADITVIKYWDGAQFISLSANIAGDVIFRGLVDASVSLDGQVVASSGNQYVVSVAGTLTATGVTFIPSAVAEIGDTLLFTSATEAYVFQRNDVYATEIQSGNIRLASQAEVTAGTEATEAVTPATLQGKLVAQKYTKQFSDTVNLVADIPFNVNHALNLVNRDAFTVNLMVGNSQAFFDIDSVDANNITITSRITVNGVYVTIQGAATA